MSAATRAFTLTQPNGDVMDGDDDIHCDTCNRTVARADAVRTETYGDLDPETWQALCCPDCGKKLKTVFVGLDE
jgi:hypothetical protein